MLCLTDSDRLMTKARVVLKSYPQLEPLLAEHEAYWTEMFSHNRALYQERAGMLHDAIISLIETLNANPYAPFRSMDEYKEYLEAKMEHCLMAQSTKQICDPQLNDLIENSGLGYEIPALVRLKNLVAHLDDAESSTAFEVVLRNHPDNVIVLWNGDTADDVLG